MERISFIKKILVRRTKRQLLLESLNLLLGYPLYLFSFLFPKDKKKWVLGNKLGFSDNAKYLYLYIAEQTEVDAYWITSDKKLVLWLRKRNLLAFYKYSLKGLYHSLTAYMYIYTTSPNAVNFFTSGGSKLVNLWHGVGIKNLLENNSSIGSSNWIYKILMPYTSKKPDYILTTSLLMNDYFKKVFSVKMPLLMEFILVVILSVLIWNILETLFANMKIKKYWILFLRSRNMTVFIFICRHGEQI